ncbi:hypothetical protein [Kouleothrix sp.]|uniref:hypothetical protein n=1 Tax=Kouleothrix sp. TaxID=2779161 RepID=UPI00391B225D
MFSFGVILSISVIAACLWTAVTSAIAAIRYRERILGLLAVSVLLLAISVSIPLTNLLIGGFGSQMETWLWIQLGIFLLGMAGLTTFNFIGGLPRLRTKGLTLKHILLVRTP